MIVLNKKLYKKNFRKSAESYYKILEKANISFSSFDKLYKFLSQKNFDTYSWWNNKKTQSVKNLFCDKFCKKTNQPFKRLNEIIR